MRPVHILILVLAGALVGAALMNVVQRHGPLAAATPGTQEKPAATPPSASPAVAPAEAQPQTQAQDTPAPPAPQMEPPTAPVAAAQPVATPVQPPKPAAGKPVRAEAKPAAKPMIVQAHRHVPPPANPRPLVVAKLDHPPSVSTAPAAATPPSEAAPAPEPQYVAPQNPLPVQESPTPQVPPAAPPAEHATPPAPPQAVPHTVTLNAGLLIPVRLVDGLTSERNSPGDSFLATIDRELVVDGFVIAERGARVEGRVVSVDRGSRTRGDASLVVELTRLYTSDRQVVPIETDPFAKRMQAERGKDAETIGAGAVLGAVIGAIAGGGKGAALGAGVGGGAGAGDVMLTRKPATLPSETRITFRLHTPVKLTENLN